MDLESDDELTPEAIEGCLGTREDRRATGGGGLFEAGRGIFALFWLVLVGFFDALVWFG